jgi:hypothetical protein
MYIDVFNGDADGICALHQLRLADPRPDARLVTGVKRDIRLLQQLAGIRNAHITVLDVSLDSNRDSLISLLKDECDILYIDHHFSGDIPDFQNIRTDIDSNPETCTSLIVNRLLNGKFSTWAVVGAFGDNLHNSANQIAAELSLPDFTVARLKELGELLNYNGYGLSVTDLFFPPQDLYRAIIPFPDPLAFLEQTNILPKLKNGFDNDMELAATYKPVRETEIGRFFELPPEPWSRRVSGVFSNLMAQERPELAHGLLTRNPDGTYRISVRAPLNNKHGADTLCRAFVTGGGRAGAAGINSLPPEQLDIFFKTFDEIFKAKKTK